MISQKRARLFHWVSVLPFLAMMVFSSVGYLRKTPEFVKAIEHLGYPIYMLYILGIAKILGTLAMLYGRNKTLKEWAYAGFTINLIGAAASHAFVRDSVSHVLTPVGLLVLVLISYYYWRCSLCTGESKQ